MTSQSSPARPGNSGGAAATPAGQQPPFAVSVAYLGRIYDYWLGGTDNFPAGRAITAYPDITRQYEERDPR